MNLVIIYGPPAAGKLTVAKELSQLTGYTLLDNHTFVDPIVEIFPRSIAEYDVARTELGRKVRIETYITAAKVGKSLITTAAPFAPGAREFLIDIKKSVESNGGTACFVFLSPNLQVLQQRISAPSRIGKKADTIERLNHMLEINPHLLDKLEGFDHLTINNSNLTPREAAERIVEFYQLDSAELL